MKIKNVRVDINSETVKVTTHIILNENWINLAFAMIILYHKTFVLRS